MRICPNCKTVCTDAEDCCSNCGKDLLSVSGQPHSTKGTTDMQTRILLSLEEQNSHLKFIALFCKIVLVLIGISYALALIYVIALMLV